MNPLTALYSGVSGLRNRLYDRGTLPARHLSVPVVSIGNLSVGGSGKTPFVIALGELLSARGIRFDILSRGYGRRTRGALVVDPQGSAPDFGDEPLLLARRLGVPVIVGESRYAAGQLAEQRFHPQLHLLDDGFQHRSLARDFDIVLMTASDFTDRLLPSGRLREPLSSLQRADAIALPSDCAATHPLLQSKPVWPFDRHLTLDPTHQPTPPCHPERSEGPMHRGATTTPSPLVFCGIARPDQFFAQVRAAGVTPAAEISFPDHHAYTAADIASLVRARRETGATAFLTTEKDAVNLAPHLASLDPLILARLTLHLADPAAVLDTILARIASRMPSS